MRRVLEFITIPASGTPIKAELLHNYIRYTSTNKIAQKYQSSEAPTDSIAVVTGSTHRK